LFNSQYRRSYVAATSGSFFGIKRTRCTNFTNLFCHETLHVSDSSSVHHKEFIHCTLSLRAGPGCIAVPSWSCSKAVYISVWHIPLLSIQWINSWWWTEELPETCRVSWQNIFVKLVHLVGFNTKKFVTMHGHMNVKLWLCFGETSVSKFTGTQGNTLLGTGNHRHSTKIRPPSLPSKLPPMYNSMKNSIIKRQVSYPFFF